MRIRSIKPEFWRSDDIDALDWDTRLIFIGCWSYVDDNGVGIDKLSTITADLFANDLSIDPMETLNRVSLGLNALHTAGLISRYSADGKDYLHITNWGKHQRVNNPNKPRWPLPTSDDAETKPPLPRPDVDPIETLSSGAGEQGSRGAVEQGSSHSSSSLTSPEIITGISDERPGKKIPVDGWKLVRSRIPESFGSTIRSGLALSAGTMLHAGTPEADVAECLALWLQEEKAGVGLLPHLLAQVIKRRTAPASGTATAKAQGWLDVTQDLGHYDQKAIS